MLFLGFVENRDLFQVGLGLPTSRCHVNVFSTGGARLWDLVRLSLGRMQYSTCTWALGVHVFLSNGLHPNSKLS